MFWGPKCCTFKGPTFGEPEAPAAPGLLVPRTPRDLFSDVDE